MALPLRARGLQNLKVLQENTRHGFSMGYDLQIFLAKLGTQWPLLVTPESAP